MAALRERQRAKGVLCAPSFSEIGGGGGSSGTVIGKAGGFMSRAAGEDAGGADAASAAAGASFCPNIKIAIVAHTTITFYESTPVELRLPQRYNPRAGGRAQELRQPGNQFKPPVGEFMEPAAVPALIGV